MGGDMATQEQVRGGVRNENITGNSAVDPRVAKFWTINPDADNYKIVLPDARDLKPGFHMTVVNTSAFFFKLVNHASVVSQQQVDSLKVAKVFLADNSTEDGAWVFIVRDLVGTPTPTIRDVGYVVGGGTSAADLYQYDVVGNAWAAKTDAPANKKNACGFAIGTNGFIVGGSVSGEKNDIDRYSHTGDTWTPRLDSPRVAWGDYPAATMVDNLGVVFGGEGANINNCEEFDETGNTWTANTDIPAGTSAPVYAATTGSDIHVLSESHFHKYTRSTDTWGSALFAAPSRDA